VKSTPKIEIFEKIFSVACTQAKHRAPGPLARGARKKDD